jgi:hypothetical protein
MATINTWEKLTKAQRELPKAKFATLAVDKALKKQPSNPYLLVCELGSECFYSRIDQK